MHAPRQKNVDVDVEVFDAPLTPVANYMLLVGFLLLLAFPATDLGWYMLRAAPDAQPEALGWRKTIEQYFGGRQTLIHLNGYVRTQLLHTSNTPKVLIGKDDWLYLADEHGVEDVRNEQPFTEAELRGWGDYLIALHEYAKQRGIRFLLTIPPNKQTIYPEHLPSWVTKIGPVSRLDQLAQYLQQHSDVNFVDLRPVLLAKKSAALLYYQTDTHWNQLGMFYGYERIAERLHTMYPALPLLRPTDFEVRHLNSIGGDLVRMLLGSEQFGRDEEISLIPRIPRRALIHDETASLGAGAIANSLLTSECEGAPVPRAVVYRDSFFKHVVPILAEQFVHAVFIWGTEVDYALLEREHPNLIIFEMIERHLFADPPAVKPPVDHQ